VSLAALGFLAEWPDGVRREPDLSDRGCEETPSDLQALSRMAGGSHMTDKRPERMSAERLEVISRTFPIDDDDYADLRELLEEATRARASELEWKAKAEAFEADVEDKRTDRRMVLEANTGLAAALAAAEARTKALTAAVEYLRDMDGLLCSCDVDERADCGFHMTIDKLDRALAEAQPSEVKPNAR
jgi:hypothetical protein